MVTAISLVNSIVGDRCLGDFYYFGKESKLEIIEGMPRNETFPLDLIAMNVFARVRVCAFVRARLMV